MLPCVQNVYRSLYPHDCFSVFQNTKASIKAALVNTAKLKDALQPELSVGSAGFVGSVGSVGSAGSSVFTIIDTLEKLAVTSTSIPVPIACLCA